MKGAFITLILFIPLFICHSQTGDISLDKSTLGEGKIVRRDVFDGNSLWGYINGGADIYLEYGFKSLLLHEIQYKGSVIRFDLYRMSDPKAAYGIFSVYTYSCDDLIGPGSINCLTKWQIQSAKNEYYLSVILPTGSREEQEYAKGIARELMSSVEKKEFDPGYPFAEGKFNTIKARIKYARGRLGIDNGIDFDSSLPGASVFKELWQLTEIEGIEDATVTVLTFAEADACKEFSENQRVMDSENKSISVFHDGLSLLLIEGNSNKEALSEIHEWFTGLKQ
ncbi:MAG: DUF6599 family protein [Bacteroidales bacterium]